MQTNPAGKAVQTPVLPAGFVDHRRLAVPATG
jgi:hypothetical protein